MRTFCIEQLEMRGDYVYNMVFDRVHRVGQKAGSKVRPIVVKFHYDSEREKVRQPSFNVTDKLKSTNHGVGVQLPKEIRDARKPLYPVMKKAKDEGQQVKFVGKKLFIDGKEYGKKPGTETSQPAGQSSMER